MTWGVDHGSSCSADPEHGDSFKTKKKACIVFVNLTAAYDAFWHNGLTCMLLRLLPNKHMIRISWSLSETKVSPLLPVTASKAMPSKNSISQGLILVTLLFNIYTYDLPSTISKKFVYADNLALLHSSRNWKDLEGTLSQDMTTLSAYLQTWRLKLSDNKMVMAAFHLNN